ncbi:MAG: glycosyltransferase [Thaumarchaeota archaeon]|nr:glycosyltransferase [Nitrososphaerota archaeon]
MICILHGYLLEGSGSNLWTRSIVKSLCENGETVHLVCQENHPDRYDFIAECYKYNKDNSIQSLLKRSVPYKGKCIMHKPQLGDTLPVYVWDKYEEFSNVIPMVDLPNDSIEEYLEHNTKVVTKIASDYNLSVILANHAVLMSVVAQRVSSLTSIPFSIMTHGSAIEYAVKKDKRFYKFANEAFSAAKKIFVASDEMQTRVKTVFSSPSIEKKITILNLGVDTKSFKLTPINLRHNNIEKLCKVLSGKRRGKKPEQYHDMIKQLYPEIQKEEILKLVADSVPQDLKSPDSDTETKLEQVDWKNDKIILFVGRFIASKGLQSIIGVMPLILEKYHNAKLIIVGHGPQREIIEVLLWALEHGYRDLVENIIVWGQTLEGSGKNSYEELNRFYKHLQNQNQLDNYFESAKKHNITNKVLFMGYLVHQELCHLFPCCDVAIFPSIVKEAGPLVFLESLASGCFPLGTYFGGMAASIDIVAKSLPSNISDLMKISVKEDQMVSDILEHTLQVLTLDERFKETLRKIAIDLYDWQGVSKKLILELQT